MTNTAFDEYVRREVATFKRMIKENEEGWKLIEEKRQKKELKRQKNIFSKIKFIFTDYCEGGMAYYFANPLPPMLPPPLSREVEIRAIELELL